MQKELTKRKIQRFGWVRDALDNRDFLYAAPPEVLGALPSQVDPRPACPPVYDQGQLGSCTANAIAGAIQFEQLKQQFPDFIPSRLFIYYNERVMEGTVASDSGAQIRDGMKSVATVGVCPEKEWQYQIDKFADNPSDACFADAAKCESKSYQRLTPSLPQLKGCLASGRPFVFGITVYNSFETDTVAQSGHVPMPGNGDQPIGGHAIMAVGYDDVNRWFIIRNSWGTGWGMDGYFTFPTNTSPPRSSPVISGLSGWLAELLGNLPARQTCSQRSECRVWRLGSAPQPLPSLRRITARRNARPAQAVVRGRN